MRECVASLGAAAAARPRRANQPRPCPTFCFCGVMALVATNDGRVFLRVRAALASLSAKRDVRVAGFIRSQRHSSCRGRHCVSGDLTRSFLPRRGVFTLMFVEDALIFPPHRTRTTQSRRHLLIYHSLAKIPSLKPSKLNHRHQAERVLLGCFVQDDSDGLEKGNKCQPSARRRRFIVRISNVF